MIPLLEIATPESVAQAVQLLAKNTGSTKIIAGGTDIIPGFQQDSVRFKGIHRLIDIHNIEELQQIRIDKSGLVLGSAVTFSQIVNSPDIQEFFPLLSDSAKQIGSPQIRNRATLAGNFINNAPCADSIAPLLVYDTDLSIISNSGRRNIKLKEFITGPYQTTLKEDELVESIVIPHTGPGYQSEFYKLGRRRAVAVSRISLAIMLKLKSGVIDDLRIACGAITPSGMRFTEIEQEARGKSPDMVYLKEIASSLGRAILENSGIRWSSPYKLPVVQQMCYAMLSKLAGQTK